MIAGPADQGQKELERVFAIGRGVYGGYLEIGGGIWRDTGDMGGGRIGIGGRGREWWGGLGQTNIKFRDATSRGQRDQDE